VKNSAIDAATQPCGGPRSAGNWSAADDEKVTAYGPRSLLKSLVMSFKNVDQVMTGGGGRNNRSRTDRHRSENWARGPCVVFKISGFEKNGPRLRLCMSKKDIQEQQQPVDKF
jgi:hypothetical protein